MQTVVVEAPVCGWRSVFRREIPSYRSYVGIGGNVAVGNNRIPGLAGYQVKTYMRLNPNLDFAASFPLYQRRVVLIKPKEMVSNEQ